MKFISTEEQGLQAEAEDMSPEDFRRVLGAVLFQVDEFRTIKNMYHVGLKKRPTRGVKGACDHPITAPVFDENGEETNKRECRVCGHRMKIDE